MELLQIRGRKKEGKKDGEKASGEILAPWTQIFNDLVIGLLDGRDPETICEAGERDRRDEAGQGWCRPLNGHPCANVHAFRKKE
jgi:hypothetical protein